MLIYIKCGQKTEGEERTAMHVSAAEVLVDNLKDLARAKDFAERVADSAVWSKVWVLCVLGAYSCACIWILLLCVYMHTAVRTDARMFVMGQGTA